MHNLATRADGGGFYEVCGRAVQADPENNPGVLQVEFFPSSSGDDLTREAPYDGNYLVLDTDFETFSAVYTCDNYGPLKSEIGWILTRIPDPEESTVLAPIFSIGLSLVFSTHMPHGLTDSAGSRRFRKERTANRPV